MKKKLTIIYTFYIILFVRGQNDLGGTDAPEGKYPYQAALRRNAKFCCGASIINNRWVLTAAHCARRITSPSNATIALGSNKSNGENGVIYNVSCILTHENYNVSRIHANDIALVRLSSEIEYSEKIKAVTLSKDNITSYTNETAVLAGWGSLNGDHNCSENLQHVKLTVIDHTRCADEWNSARGHKISRNQICTVSKLRENTISYGDSGSPLVLNNEQIGIGSFAWKDLPDVFVRVSKYTWWIDRRIEEYELNRHNKTYIDMTCNKRKK